MNLYKRITSAMLVLTTVLSLSGAGFVFAQTEDLNELQDQISVRKTQIDQINDKIDGYREKVNQYASEAASLETDIAMIENQVALSLILRQRRSRLRRRNFKFNCWINKSRNKR